MKLITKQMEKLFQKYPFRSQENEEDPVAIAKYFFPVGRATWYVFEAEKISDKDYIFFGYVVSPLGKDCDELGTFTLSELEGVNIPVKLGGFTDTIKIERDLYFQPMKLSEIMETT